MKEHKVGKETARRLAERFGLPDVGIFQTRDGTEYWATLVEVDEHVATGEGFGSWGEAVVDASRVDEFLAAYETGEFELPDKLALMELCLASYWEWDAEVHWLPKETPHRGRIKKKHAKERDGYAKRIEAILNREFLLLAPMLYQLADFSSEFPPYEGELYELFDVIQGFWFAQVERLKREGVLEAAERALGKLPACDEYS